ncbi:MAG: EAL domain-containing protein [Pseudomonadota bacterium]
MDKTKTALLLVALALCVVSVNVAVADEWKTVQPGQPFRGYTPRDGLSQAVARHIAQDQYGYLWIATRRGLSKYDGRDFANFTIADGLPANFLTFVYPDGKDIWIGDARGNVSLLRDGEIRVVAKIPDDRRSPVTGIVRDGAELFIATAGQGLQRVLANASNETPRTVYAVETAIRDLALVDNKLWFVNNEHLFSLETSTSSAPMIERANVVASFFSPSNEHWIADRNSRIGVLTAGIVEQRAEFTTAGLIKDLAVGRNGEIWVTTDRELYKHASYTEANGEVASRERSFDNFGRVLALFVDRESTLWIGAESRLWRYLGDRFEHYEFEGFGYDANVWSIQTDARGGVFAGTNTELLQFRNDRVRSLNDIAGIPSGPVRNLILANQNTLYVGIHEVGIYRLDTRNWQATLLPGTDRSDVLAMALDGRGRLWVGRSDGLHVIQTNGGTLRPASDQTTDSVYSIDIADDGDIWFGVDRFGLARLRPDAGNEVIIYGADSGFTTTEVNHVRWLANDRVWVGTENGGLYNFDGTSATNIAPQTPLRDQSAYLVEETSDGFLIVGGEEGLFHIDPETLSTYHYSVLHGFSGIETNVHASHIDNNGYLWVGTVSGLSRMDLRQPRASGMTLEPDIVSARSIQTGAMVPAGAEVPWAEKGVSIEYAAVSLLYPRAIEYSYRLVGRDADWSAATGNRYIEFAGLAPGSYRLEVRARFSNQPWTDAVARYPFTILPPFWLAPWFLILVALALVLVVPLLIKWRMRQVELANRRLRREVLERTRGVERAKAHLEATNRRLSKEVDERRKADLARAEVETRFTRAFQSSPIGMAIITPDGFIVEANASLQAMLWPEADGFESEHTLIESVIEDDKPAFERSLRRLVSGGEDTADAELRMINSTGTELDTLINLSAIRDDRGEYKYSMCQVQDVTEARRMTDQLAYQASYDALTNLLNRRAFEDALARIYRDAAGASTHSYLMFMDLDQFKVVNDTSGHAAGDELLRTVSQLIRNQVRSDDIVGRLGGDEFALVLWQCPEAVAMRIAESIRAAVENLQFNWDTETYRIGVSIGAVPLDPELGDLSELQQLADAACFEAKDAGRNRIHIVRSADDAVSGHRGEAQWVQRLRDAMDHDRFALYGQIIKPTIARPDEPERMEILLRMRDPATRKLIPPGAFLPAAERFGLSSRLDQWVVENLIRTLYVHEAFGAGNRRYWVNLSGNSVGDRRFAEFLVDAIQNSPLPAGMLNFEITETAVIRSVSDAGKLMARLRDLGCQFALDDFGSGLSSFGYLKKLPVDYLKIDGMFVRDILNDSTDRMFVRSIIDIAHTMGIKVVTEFVENDEMLNAVASFGTDYVQGYGIHRPEVLFPQFPVRTPAQATAGDPPSAEQRQGHVL